MRMRSRYHLLGSSLFFVSFSTASAIRSLLSRCKFDRVRSITPASGVTSTEKSRKHRMYSLPYDVRVGTLPHRGLDDLEPLAPRVDERPAAHRQREHRRGVPEVHVRDNRKVVPYGALQDNLVQLLALLRGVAVRASEEEAPEPRERTHVFVVHEDAVYRFRARFLLGGLQEQDGAVQLRPVRRAAQVLHRLQATTDENALGAPALQPRPAVRSLPSARGQGPPSRPSPRIPPSTIPRTLSRRPAPTSTAPPACTAPCSRTPLDTRPARP